MLRNVARRLERAKYNAGNPDDGAGWGDLDVNRSVGSNANIEQGIFNIEYRRGMQKC
jgi:hypothetical protein